MSRRVLWSSRLSAVLIVAGMTMLFGCRTEAEIRIENGSTLDFTEVRVAGQHYGTIEAGATSPYKPVGLRFRYAALGLTAGGHTITGQTLNLGSKRFTYRIDVVDLSAGHLAIEVVRD